MLDHLIILLGYLNLMIILIVATPNALFLFGITKFALRSFRVSIKVYELFYITQCTLI